MDSNNNQENKNKFISLIADDKPSKKVIVAVIGIGMLMLVAGNFLVLRNNHPQPERSENFVVEPQPQNMPVLQGNATAQASNQLTQPPKQMSKEEMALIVQKQKELELRLTAPMMVVNNNSQEKFANETSQSTIKESDPNKQFLEAVSTRGSNPLQATSIGSLKNIIAEGSLIHAILEPATNSDLPGNLRAIVSEPSYSEDGSQVLIPRGSRLIGEYKSGMLQGQSRIFIVWTRLITPAGISVQLGSSGVDSLGVAGLGADSIDRHFWQKFGTASLLSIIGAGAANSVSDQMSPASLYRSAVANSFSQSVNESLQQEGMIAPTLKTYQGKPIMVFVAHDLQFGDALKNNNNNINIF